MQHQLFVKLSKCEFGALHVEYLRHVINKQGLAMDKDKAVCIVGWPYLQPMKKVKRLLGLTCYYKWFIREYGIIT